MTTDLLEDHYKPAVRDLHEHVERQEERIRELEQHAKIRAALHQGDVNTLSVRIRELETEYAKLQQVLKELTPEDIRELTYVYNVEVTEKLKAAEARIQKAREILERDVMTYVGGPHVQIRHALEALDGN